MRIDAIVERLQFNFPSECSTGDSAFFVCRGVNDNTSCTLNSHKSNEIKMHLILQVYLVLYNSAITDKWKKGPVEQNERPNKRLNMTVTCVG